MNFYVCRHQQSFNFHWFITADHEIMKNSPCNCQLDLIQSYTDSQVIGNWLIILRHKSCFADGNWRSQTWSNHFKGHRIKNSTHMMAIILIVLWSPTTVICSVIVAFRGGLCWFKSLVNLSHSVKTQTKQEETWSSFWLNLLKCVFYAYNNWSMWATSSSSESIWHVIHVRILSNSIEWRFLS